LRSGRHSGFALTKAGGSSARWHPLANRWQWPVRVLRQSADDQEDLAFRVRFRSSNLEVVAEAEGVLVNRPRYSSAGDRSCWTSGIRTAGSSPFERTWPGVKAQRSSPNRSLVGTPISGVPRCPGRAVSAGAQGRPDDPGGRPVSPPLVRPRVGDTSTRAAGARQSGDRNADRERRV
jgi:hypothetical protein